MHYQLKGCPCGYLTDARGRCRCSARQVQSYLSKISGPLLDRIDLHVEVPALSFECLSAAAGGDSSETMRRRILRAQRRRMVARKNSVEAAARGLLKKAVCEFGLSGRSYHKILSIARTIANLADSPAVLQEHIAEAIQYRCLDRQTWL